MKLTDTDIAYFIKNGYQKEDIPQLEKCVQKVTYELENGETLKEKDVLTNMSRTTWLSGIGRCCFHYTCVREDNNGTCIYFDAHRLFE